MSVSNWMKPGYSSKQRVKIMTVDPSTRRIEGALKDGAMIQIAVWEVSAVFTWPQTDEYWTVYKENGYWMLGSKMVAVEDETTQIEDLDPGHARIGSDTIITPSGAQLLTTATAVSHSPDPYWTMNSVRYETFNLNEAATLGVVNLNGGLLRLNGGIVLVANDTITEIGFLMGNFGLSGTTHLWATVVRASDMTVVARTIDEGATNPAANSFHIIPLESDYTPTLDEPVYLGICADSSGANLRSLTFNTQRTSFGPTIAGVVNSPSYSGGPPAIGTTINAPAIGTGNMYMTVS